MKTRKIGCRQAMDMLKHISNTQKKMKIKNTKNNKSRANLSRYKQYKVNLKV